MCGIGTGLSSLYSRPSVLSTCIHMMFGRASAAAIGAVLEDGASLAEAAAATSAAESATRRTIAVV